MPQFIVNVREVHVQPYLIEAATLDEAITKVEEGEGDILEAGFEYSHTLETDSWDGHEAEKSELDEFGME
jgi:hypothetical protein